MQPKEMSINEIVDKINQVIGIINYTEQQSSLRWTKEEEVILENLANLKMKWIVIAQILGKDGRFPQRTGPQVSQHYRKVIRRRESNQ
ncbi:Myb-like DNA-binding domain-containing protein [Spironucleus salmonicida]|uniref:Myb-like DNA-binding domain-containing protein n=1 Tax=Spironucleus salmonicida TaxID=348837 RepID=V6LGH5_9EUKA|nr:Myb-like DNA-binding domain-containing protein [Spironucleus salmonicida]|eukprot:EST42781.1 Myb-like DNA-binding domain-containing protein [Spironucleus salmonicida]